MRFTDAQIRAARVLLRWSAEGLANATVIGVATVSRAETGDGAASLICANLKAIQQASERPGVEFIPRNGGSVGVCFKKSSSGSSVGGGYQRGNARQL